jgi:transcriptional adapter 2-alpha
MLVEGLELFGIGNWEHIAEHIGTKNSLECSNHYNEIYVQSETWPWPVIIY